MNQRGVSAESLLREKGLRVTAQRRMVLQYLLDHEGSHFTADQVRDALLPLLPELAKGTMYKTLQDLTAVNIVELLPTPQGYALYGLRLKPHQHFYCVACHGWFDVQPNNVEALTFDAPGFVIETVDVTLRGLCPACAKQNTLSTAARAEHKAF
ncbi:MAG: transcriptional repressor [Sulfobacillus thermosulfidooxidans]|uniref:Fur family transcriptional regulator n=1 Tax=Sulfobacillus thermotolerans TaxID=338644 RepID=A0ABN5H3D7_9FIRM|nr:transcriptional repressor [Sulfobacillus sp. hq2]AUW95217.1 hypothetical protein BXT84_15655 [Sulfobacillus thermotolerans]MCY0909138.1 transcriptional repressor [Sulfobacillus thermotolerans]POB10537.1 Fur family transcriptional regulator [Sulfobacillus sp. hq2]PSR37387.1 MAG: transcriptional repressor [Sulfobacillus thermosulfidooxidans]